jgi:hypothetical protein
LLVLFKVTRPGAVDAAVSFLDCTLWTAHIIVLTLLFYAV